MIKRKDHPSREIFEKQRKPRFGKTNPERMQLEFWEWMVRPSDPPNATKGGILAKLGQILRRGELKSANGPYRARDLYNVPIDRDDGPIWTFDRMGRTRTELPDGRVICVGGEHEDCYDPDFCIYNDLVVFFPHGRFEIYGYPRQTFPPTDFHTATFKTGELVIIGCVGYAEDRNPMHTPVYSINLSNYQISEITTTGESPGWISRHEATLHSDGVIVLRGGNILTETSDGQRYKKNFEEFALDTENWTWSRLTDRNWKQYSIRQANHGLFVLDENPALEKLISDRAFSLLESPDGSESLQLELNGITVEIQVDIAAIEIVVKGALPPTPIIELLEEVRQNVQTAIQRPCVLDPADV